MLDSNASATWITLCHSGDEWHTHRELVAVAVEAAAQLGVHALAVDDDLVGVCTYTVLHLRQTALLWSVWSLARREAGRRLEQVFHAGRTRRSWNDDTVNQYQSKLK